MLEQASSDIGKAMRVESRRRTDEVRLNDLIHQIDELLWELEGLNLQDRPTVPDELLPRITLLVAEATQGPPPRADEVREPLAFKYEAYASWGGASGFVPAERIRANFDTFAADRFIIGSESQVVDLIGRYGERTGTDHMLLRVQWPGLDQKTVVRTLERLGRVVEKLK